MDRQLTERMVGAALLLGALVVVVPMILDGGGQPPRVTAEPDGEPIDLRTHTIHLDGAERAPPVPRARAAAGPAPADGPVTQSAVADGALADGGITDDGPVASAPVPVTPLPATPDRTAASTGSVEGPASRATATRPEADPAARPASGSPPTVAPATQSREEPGQDTWYVQLGSFSSRENANRLAADLERKGFSSVISPLKASGGRTLYRVRAGGFESREEADQLARRLGSAGFPGGQLAR